MKRKGRGPKAVSPQSVGSGDWNRRAGVWLGSLPLLFLFLIGCSLKGGRYSPESRGENVVLLGQPLPGLTPEVFGPGIVSRAGVFEHSSAYVTPDFGEIYWIADLASSRNRRLLFVQRQGENWSVPQDAGISDHYSNSNISFSPTGDRIYFSSRAKIGGGEHLKDTDIWYSDRTGDGWAEPVNLGAPVNTGNTEALGAVLPTGTIFYSDYGDIFMAEYVGGRFQTPVRLPFPINTDEFDLAPFVPAHEGFLLFESTRPGGEGGADLYVAFREGDGVWGDPVNLGPQVNSPAHERSPVLSPDGEILFFWRVTSTSDIYWVDAAVIDSVRARHVHAGREDDKRGG